MHFSRIIIYSQGVTVPVEFFLVVSSMCIQKYDCWWSKVYMRIVWLCMCVRPLLICRLYVSWSNLQGMLFFKAFDFFFPYKSLHLQPEESLRGCTVFALAYGSICWKVLPTGNMTARICTYGGYVYILLMMFSASLSVRHMYLFTWRNIFNGFFHARIMHSVQLLIGKFKYRRPNSDLISQEAQCKALFFCGNIVV